MHLICLPKFCITFVFHFSWVLQPSQDELKTMLMQFFFFFEGGGGVGQQIRWIMGNGESHVRSIIRAFFKDPTTRRQRALTLLNEGTISKKRETKFCRLNRCLFTFSRKRKMRYFDVVVVQKRRRNVGKSVMHVQIVGVLVKPIVFWRFHRRVVGREPQHRRRRSATASKRYF